MGGTWMTEIEKMQIEDMRKNGMSYHRIALAVDRNVATVYYHFNSNKRKKKLPTLEQIEKKIEAQKLVLEQLEAQKTQQPQ
jgi:hypothetical protein